MTTALRIGLICEGGTDSVVLRAIMDVLCAPGKPAYIPLQPRTDKLDHIGLGGWQAVRAFLQRSATTIAASPLDMIVVQVDADIRALREVASQLAPIEQGADELEPLCRHVKSWMATDVPASVVIALPRESTEAWLIAATTRKKNVEAIPKPTQVLVEHGLLSAAKGKGAKAASTYEELVRPLLPKIDNPKELAAIPELERFIAKARSRIRRVATETKAARGTRT